MNGFYRSPSRCCTKYGDFHSYGAAMKVNGEIVSVAAHDGREFPPSVETIALLKDAFVKGAQEGTYKATGWPTTFA